MIVAQDGEEDLEAAKERSWEYGIASDSDVKCACHESIVSLRA